MNYHQYLDKDYDPTDYQSALDEIQEDITDMEEKLEALDEKLEPEERNTICEGCGEEVKPEDVCNWKGQRLCPQCFDSEYGYVPKSIIDIVSAEQYAYEDWSADQRLHQIYN